jgi:ferredoxin
MKKNIKVEDIGKNKDRGLTAIEREDLFPLYPPYDEIEKEKKWKEISAEKRNEVACNLDGVIALGLPLPKDKEEEKEQVDRFMAGLEKILLKENNWIFLQPLMLSLEYCAKCQTCNDACPIFEESGGNDVYRPTYRSEVWRRLVNKYAKGCPKILAKFRYGDIDLNWTRHVLWEWTMG